MRKGYIVTAVVLSLLVIAFSTSANASRTRSDTFSVQIDSAGSVTGGDGSGFNSGAWYTYPTTDTYSWHSQWFNAQPFHPNGSTVFDSFFHVEQILPGAASFEFGISWSTLAWSDRGHGDTLPPIPANQGGDPNLDESVHLGRHTIFTTQTTADDGVTMDFDLIIMGWPVSDFSPEWIAVNFRGFNFEVTEGKIDHTSTVPVPGAIWLLGSGILGLLVFRKRNTFKR